MVVVATGMIVDQRDGALVPASPPADRIDDDVRVKIGEAMTALNDTLTAYPDDRRPLGDDPAGQAMRGAIGHLLCAAEAAGLLVEWKTQT